MVTGQLGVPTSLTPVSSQLLRFYEIRKRKLQKKIVFKKVGREHIFLVFIAFAIVGSPGDYFKNLNRR